MSRRRPPGELQFGSDSFLDVVANIVGILIILIVIAGLRVSQTPVMLTPAKTDSTEPVVEPVVSSMPEIPGLPEAKEEPKTPQVVVLDPVEDPAEEPEPPPPPLPALVIPKELVIQTDQLESDLKALKDEEAKLAKRLKLSGQQQNVLLERQRAIESLVVEKKQELDAFATSRPQKRKPTLREALAGNALERLSKQVRELELSPKNVESLEHKITPISRVVNGTEKHYRLEKNRVVEVPIEEL